MAYVIIHHFSGATQEQYEVSIKEAHGGLDVLPPGQVFHAAGKEGDGFTVVGVYDTKQHWETFRDTVVVPKLQAGVEGGFSGMPDEQAFETINLLP